MSREPASQSNNSANDDRTLTHPPDTFAAPTVLVRPPQPNHNPVVPPSILRIRKIDPGDAAAEIWAEFLQTLRYSDQSNALKKQADEFINVFNGYYSESKKIEKALMEASSYSPKNCSVKLNHQPIDPVVTGAASTSCANELAASIAEYKLTRGTFDLRLMKINATARKMHLVEIMASTSTSSRNSSASIWTSGLATTTS